MFLVPLDRELKGLQHIKKSKFSTNWSKSYGPKSNFFEKIWVFGTLSIISFLPVGQEFRFFGVL